LKSWLELTYPLLIAASLDTFCLVAPQRLQLAKKVRLWRIGSRIRAFQQAINQGSMPPLTSSNGDQTPKFVVFHTSFDNKGRQDCCKVSLYKNCQQQSCSAINCLSSNINILAGDSSVPLTSECKGTDPHWKHLRCIHFAS